MINPVQAFAFVRRSTPPVFNEGAASTAAKVMAFAAAAMASLASFVFLPAQAAVTISAGAVALLSMLCCVPSNGATREDGQPARWYHPVVDAFRVFVPRGAVPVVQAGPRVPVGGVVYPHVAPIVVPRQQPLDHQEGPRVPVGHGHRIPAVEGGFVQPEARVMYRGQEVPQQQPLARVPVGHR